MDRFYLSLCIWIYIGNVLCARCPVHWLEGPGTGSCYRFWPSRLKSWPDARATCLQRDGDLLRLDSKEETDWIIREVMKYPASYEWWIGLKRHPGNDSIWQWTNGVQRNETNPFIVWGSGEPNNSKNPEDCGEVLDNLLSDKNCDYPLQFICERPKDLEMKCDVDNGWDDITSGKCFKLFDPKVTFEEAMTTCERSDAKLLTISNETEQSNITDFLDTLSKPTVWLAYQANKRNSTWAAEEVITYSSWWEAASTDFKSISENDTFCSVLDTNITGYNNWKPMKCDSRASTMCVKDADNYLTDPPGHTTLPTTTVSVQSTSESFSDNYLTYPPGQTTLPTTTVSVQSTSESFSVSKCGVGWDVGFGQGVCYKFVPDLSSWSEAQDKCVEGGGNLISILSDEEQSYVTGRLQGMAVLPEAIWIGANDRDMESGWRWTDGKPFAYFNWAAEPNDFMNDDESTSASGEDCAAIVTGRKENFGLWNDLLCSNKLGYVCKKDALSEGTTTSATPKPAEDPEIIEFYQRKEDTRPDFRSHDLYEMGVKQTGSFRFSVKTKHDAHIMLHKDRGDFDSKNNYLVIIGGWGNTKSIVETVGGNERVVSEDMGLLTSNEYRWFWIYWNATNINVGKTETIGNDVFLTLEGQITDINYVSVGTAQGTDAWWRIPKESNVYGCEGNGWLKYRDSCYLLVEEIKDWNEASRYCRKEGSELASISDKNEQNFIFSLLPRDSYCFNIYENNTKCNMWAERGECERNPVWMSTHCHLACKLCMHNCRDLYPSSKKCMEWADMGDCGRNSTWMIPNCAMSCGICQGAPNRGFWIGMKRISTQKSYSWSDNEVVKFTHWDTHQPRGFSRVKGSCAAVFLQNGKWNDGDCDDPLPGFICKQPQILMPITTVSPFAVGCTADDSYGYGSYCYVYVKSEKSWAEAKSNCATIGGTLVYIDDSYTQAFVASELQNLLHDHWIGLSLTNGNFTWDGRRPATLKMTHFEKPGFITTFNTKKQSGCFAMTTVKPVGLWKLYSDCAYKLPSICQITRDGYTTPPSTTTTALPETTEFTYKCEEGWTFFNHEGRKSCFYISNEKEIWKVAQRTCSSYGASMLTIESFNENLIFEKIISSDSTLYDEPVWLGLREGDTGYYEWEDGSPATFYNWDYDEPNNKDEDCVEILPDTGNWNDVNCYHSNYFICQIPYGKSVIMTNTEQNTSFFGIRFKYTLNNVIYKFDKDGEL